jgi:hypothetical protein
MLEEWRKFAREVRPRARRASFGGGGDTVQIGTWEIRVTENSASRRSPTLRHRPRRLRFARLAQEAEGAGGRLRPSPPSFEDFEEKIRNNHNGHSGSERNGGCCCAPNEKIKKPCVCTTHSSPDRKRSCFVAGGPVT